MKILLGCLLALLVSGCAMAPSQQEMAAADYGSPIAQDVAQAKVIEFLSHTLKDPESARIEWGMIEKGWVKDGAVYGGATVFGYGLSARVNAKNSFGGYVGAEPYFFLFRNGDLVRAQKVDPQGLVTRLQ